MRNFLQKNYLWVLITIILIKYLLLNDYTDYQQDSNLNRTIGWAWEQYMEIFIFYADLWANNIFHLIIIAVLIYYLTNFLRDKKISLEWTYTLFISILIFPYNASIFTGFFNTILIILFLSNFYKIRKLNLNTKPNSI